MRYLGRTVSAGEIKNIAKLYENYESGAEAQATFDARVSDIGELQAQKSAVFDNAERCNGAGYTVGDYEPLSPDEIQNAVNSGA